MLIQCEDILLVEDDDDDVYLFNMAIANANLDRTVKRFTNGQELLDYLSLIAQSDEVLWPKLILLDLNMPGVDGREAVKILSSDPRYKHLPTVIYTTSDSRQDIIDCYNNGAKSYIVKRSTVDELTECVENLANYWFKTVTLV